MANIKKIKVGNIEYEIDASYLGGLSAEEWENMIDAHTSINGPFISSTNPTAPTTGATATVLWGESTSYPASSYYPARAIYLFNNTSSTTNYEWMTADDGQGDPDSVHWVCIGTSSTDMQHYVRKGTYTTAAPSTINTGTPSVEYTDFGEHDQAHNRTETMTITIPVTSHSIYNGQTGKTISQTVTTDGSHSHAIDTDPTTVVVTTPSWSASVVSEVLSFTFNAGSTATIQAVGGEDPVHNRYITQDAGYHYHSLREYTNGSWTSIASSFNVVSELSTTVAYFVGTVPASDIPQNVTVAATVEKHFHSMKNHTHSMNNHTHEIDLN